jgi:hypothetical protein
MNTEDVARAETEPLQSITYNLSRGDLFVGYFTIVFRNRLIQAFIPGAHSHLDMRADRT